MIAVFSLRHSGTHFTLRAIGAPDAPWWYEDPNAEVIKAHADPMAIDQIRPILEGRKVIIPRRNNSNLRASWARRGYQDLLGKCQAALRQIPGHNFNIENPDFDRLEAFLERPINRRTDPVPSIGRIGDD